MAEAKCKDGVELISPAFYTSQYGYKLQVRLCLKITDTVAGHFTFQRPKIGITKPGKAGVSR